MRIGDINQYVIPWRCIFLSLLLCVVLCSVSVWAEGEGEGEDDRIPRILFVGDSYVESTILWGVTDQVMADYGFGHYSIEGSMTAVGGTTADELASNAEHGLDKILAKLSAYPTIDIVQVTVGAIDCLDVPYYLTVNTPEEMDVYYTTLASKLETIVDYILAIRPNIRVVLAEYDYMNLELITADYADFVAGVTQRMFNDAFVEVGRRKKAIAEARDRCYYVQNWGILQHHWGYPDVYEPGETPLPGDAPDYDPYPGGDPDYSVSAEYYMWEDGIHPISEGLYWILEHAMIEYYAEWLREDPMQEGEGEGQNSGGEPPTCANTAMVCQLPLESTGTNAFIVSDDQQGTAGYDEFYGLIYPIEEVVFWGLRSTQDPVPCQWHSDSYKISFYADDSGTPGELVKKYYLNPQRLETSWKYFDIYTLYEYHAILQTPLTLDRGWISIEAVFDTSMCLFVWMSSQKEYSVCYEKVGDEWTQKIHDLSFMLLGGPPQVEGEGEGGVEAHAADWEEPIDYRISLSELLRVIQFFNSTGYSCIESPERSDDGYQVGLGKQDCPYHSSDYHGGGGDWHIDLSELLRLIQFFNSDGYQACIDTSSEDGYCAGAMQE